MSYDSAAPRRHEYLAERVEVDEASQLLPEQKYELPAMWLQTPIHPGMYMPVLLKRCLAGTRQAIAKALAAPRPYTGYVACGQDPDGLDSNLAHTHVCIAFLAGHSVDTHSIITPSGLKMVPDSVVLLGKHRARCMSIDMPARARMSHHAASAVTYIENDRSCCKMPREFHGVLGCTTYWGLAEARMFDAQTILSRVLKLYQQVMPTVEVPSITDGELMSFWLLESLPLSPNRQHELFCMPALQRLQRIRRLLEGWQQMATFTCNGCESIVGLLRDTISDVTDFGPSGTFVNPHGCLHTISFTSKVEQSTVRCYGEPTTDFSWFPGYAWTTALCAECTEHLGWRFSRVSGDGPEEFWGITHASVAVSASPYVGKHPDEIGLASDQLLSPA